jgi:predicted dehydrogenase
VSSAAYRVGIVGSSFGGAVHAPAFAAQGRFEVVALASPTRAAEVAKARKIPHAFSSVDEMLAGVNLDVVAIASPPFDHLPSVRAALGAGLHVLCEKPFALNVNDAEEMLALAERAGTVCAIAHEFRYTPQSQALHELARNGHLGALRAIEVNVAARMLRADVERPSSWWFERARGGGLTGAYLSHQTDLANFLAGSAPLRATGFERTAIPERHAGGITFTSDVADGAFATIDYGGGLIASVAVDGTRATESTTIAIHGETSTAVASGAICRRSSSTTKRRASSSSPRNRTRICAPHMRICPRSSRCSMRSPRRSTIIRRSFRPLPTASRRNAYSKRSATAHRWTT